MTASGKHVYYGKAAAPPVSLDRDDQRGNGCETITFDPSTEDFHYFYVHHYAGEHSMRDSNAKVTIHVGSCSQVVVVNPQLPFKGTQQDFWRVCKIFRDGRVQVHNDCFVRDNHGVPYSW